MAAAGNGRGGLGWVILVVALAVPGVLFYNWWSHLKAEREKTVAAKARGRVPDGGVFQSSPNAKLVNPMTPAASTSTPAGAPTDAAAAPLASAANAASLPAPEPVAAAAAPAPAAAPPVSAAAPPAPAVSTAAAPPPLKRDPTLSPFDQMRMVAAEEARRKAAEDLENMKRPRPSGRRPPADIKSTVELQGIISNPEGGNKAIVNNEVVGPGEMVGKVRVVRITDSGVVFEYMGKRFSKGVSRD